ncbi:MAG TPA: c-type cytochrome domain-containing protein, partial [Anaerolineales bacterium]|nr:c-type cytochrome domain-containing protein [Anaerolineales bacterium]
LTYTAAIQPLFETRCGSCHGPTGSLQGLDLTSYQTALKGGTGGPAIVPGDAENSLVVIKQSGAQPHFGQLAPEELDLVIEWIQAGAPE